MTEGCNCLVCRAARALRLFVKGEQKKQFRCSGCGHKFEAYRPPDTIPASGVWCPICQGIGEEVGKLG